LKLIPSVTVQEKFRGEGVLMFVPALDDPPMCASNLSAADLPR